MNEQIVTATQMVWQPRLLRLTKIPHPDLNDGEPEAAYIRPDFITKIHTTWVTQEKMHVKDEKYGPVICTYIALQGGDGFHVMEPPDVIAAMRDRALGFEPQLDPVE